MNPREKKRNAKVFAGLATSGKYFVGCKSFSIKAKMLILFISACLGAAVAIDAQSFSNSFEKGTWGCEKIWEGVLYFHDLLHFYDPIFLSLLKGYMRCPLLPPPVCIYDSRALFNPRIGTATE